MAVVDVKDSDSGDNGRTNCSMDSDTFNFRPDAKRPSAYVISVSRPLNREVTPRVLVEVTCQDGGNPPLSRTTVLDVVVEDVNDHAPEFSRESYMMTVKENQEKGEFVGQVRKIRFAFFVNSGHHQGS